MSVTNNIIDTSFKQCVDSVNKLTECLLSIIPRVLISNMSTYDPQGVKIIIDKFINVVNYRIRPMVARRENYIFKLLYLNTVTVENNLIIFYDDVRKIVNTLKECLHLYDVYFIESYRLSTNSTESRHLIKKHIFSNPEQIASVYVPKPLTKPEHKIIKIDDDFVRSFGQNTQKALELVVRDCLIGFRHVKTNQTIVEFYKMFQTYPSINYNMVENIKKDTTMVVFLSLTLGMSCKNNFMVELENRYNDQLHESSNISSTLKRKGDELDNTIPTKQSRNDSSVDSHSLSYNHVEPEELDKNILSAATVAANSVELVTNKNDIIIKQDSIIAEGKIQNKTDDTDDEHIEII